MNEIKKQEIKHALQVMEKDISDQVFNRLNELEATGQLIFPPNYAVGNALKSAYLILQETKDKDGKPVLETCTKASIANSLLDMVIQGLNPVKKQCYFIPFGGKLQLFRSYFGDQTVVKNALPGVENIFATVIYEGDEVEIDINDDGEHYVKSHKTKFENRDKPIKGAYATIIIDGKKHQEIMTWQEIQVAWSKSLAKNQGTHKEFPQEMAKRTVIRRLCKRFLNTSNDANLLVVESYNRTTSDEYDNNNDYVETQEGLKQQVDAKANSEELVIEGEVVEEQAHEPEEESRSTLFHEEDLPPFAWGDVDGDH